MSTKSVSDGWTTYTVETKNLDTKIVYKTVASYEEYSVVNFPSPVGARKPTYRPLAWTEASLFTRRYNKSVYTTTFGRTEVKGPARYNADPNALTLIQTESNESDAVRLYFKAKAGVGSGPVNLAENLGDGKKTAEMIAKRVRQLAEAAKQLKNGNLKALYRALHIDGHPSRREQGRVRDTPRENRLADHWLEYTYGWKPLVQDVHGALEAYRKGLLQKGEVVKQSNAKRTPPKRGDSPTSPGKRASGYFSGRISNPEAHLINGLGLLNPASLYWELMPYSFVVDWFLPVGDVLSSLTAGIGMEGCVGGYTYESTRTTTVGGVNWITDKTAYRHSVAGLPSIVKIKLNVWDQSWQHAVSAVALLKQRFR